MSDPKTEILSRTETITARENAPNLAHIRLEDPRGNQLTLDDATQIAIVYARKFGKLVEQCRPDHWDTQNRVNALYEPEPSALAAGWLKMTGTLYSDNIAPVGFIPNLCKKSGTQQK